MRSTTLLVMAVVAACSKVPTEDLGAGGRGGGGTASGSAGVGGQAEPDPACMLAGGGCSWSGTPCPNVGPQHCDAQPAHGAFPAIDQFCCLPCPSGQHGVYADDGGSCVAVQSQSVCGGSTERVQAAVVHMTASSNSPPIDVVIYCDASAERTLASDLPNNNVGITPRTWAAGSPEIVKFLAELDASGDVSQFSVTIYGCAKSASFGTVTTITALGKTSGDVQCLRYFPSPAEDALRRDCDLLTEKP